MLRSSEHLQLASKRTWGEAIQGWMEGAPGGKDALDVAAGAWTSHQLDRGRMRVHWPLAADLALPGSILGDQAKQETLKTAILLEEVHGFGALNCMQEKAQKRTQIALVSVKLCFIIHHCHQSFPKGDLEQDIIALPGSQAWDPVKDKLFPQGAVLRACARTCRWLACCTENRRCKPVEVQELRYSCCRRGCWRKGTNRHP